MICVKYRLSPGASIGAWKTEPEPSIMVRIIIAAVMFIAMCALTFATVSAGETQRSAAQLSNAPNAPTVQVYSNRS